MLDTSELTPTSAKRSLRWRDPSLTFLLLTSRSADDVVLAVRQVQYPTRQEVTVVDDATAALAALRGEE